jgi:spore coat protein H
MKTSQRKAVPYRILESGIIALFLLVSMLLLILMPKKPQAQAINTGIAEAIASAMPNQGWAPMTVYFSAFGSHSSAGQIVKYQWDLDGNGRLDTDATARGGYAQYTYQRNGEYTVTLQVTDELGNIATDSILVDVRHPGSSSVDYWTVFDDSQVRKVEVQLTQANWDLMWQDIEAKVEVPANAVVFGETLENVGFRMRGQFSMRESGWKKPWKINTDAYIADQEYHNLRQLMLINAIGDPSLMTEKLSYDMMHFAGVPASHTTYVQFWIDITDDNAPSTFWGVYTMIERVDRKFIGSRYGQEAKDGNLYKASHAQRGPMDLAYYGNSIEDYPMQNGQYAYGKENNEVVADYSDIVQVCSVVDGVQYASPEDFAQALEQVFNVDSFLRYMAVIALTMNWDSYPYTGNNFYLFNNPVSGKFEWIPWDLTWGGDINMPLFQHGEFVISPKAPLFERVFEVERYRRQYAAYLDMLMRNFFNYETIYQRAQAYHDMIAPYLQQGEGDKMYFGEGSSFNIAQFESSWQDLPELTRQRNEVIRQLLDQDRYLDGLTQ